MRADHRPAYLDWKTSKLLWHRDHALAWIAEQKANGTEHNIYSVDLVVRMLERELDKRTIATPVGSLQVIADVEDLEAAI